VDCHLLNIDRVRIGMNINVTDEFKAICNDILNENKTEEEWAEIESDDMFQTNSFSGGYDADEEAFCFSFYNEDSDEYWFQLTLEEIKKVVSGDLSTID
jgi:hypothetical protein